MYQRLKKLSYIADQMQQKGVRVDVPYIRNLEEQFTQRKDELFPSHREGKKVVFEGFNPRSGPQTLEYFAGQGISLKTTQKSDIRVVLERLARKVGARDIEELERIESIPKVTEDLLKLYQYKASGKGLKAWFDAKYIDKDDLVHPRWIMTATSTGRGASSNPNFMNIPVRGFGAKVRSAIIPREKGLKLLKCDASQMELRKCLHAAGVERKLGTDAFADLVTASGGQFEKAAKAYSMSARDIAKSVSHASDYGEGLQVVTELDLRKETIQREIKVGARLVLEDWEYAGGVVSFTGANLSERLFGDKSYDHRRAALQIQEIYFSTFPEIRPWQKGISQKIDARGCIQSATGRYLELYGSPEDNLKAALAFIGQGEGADFMLEKMTRYFDEMKELWLLFIHDEKVVEIPCEWGTAEIKKYTEILREESVWLPGFSCPFVIKVGPNWGQMEKLSI